LFSRFFTSPYSNLIGLFIVAWLASATLQSLFRYWVLSFQDQKSIAIYFEIIPSILTILGLFILTFTDLQYLLIPIICLMGLISLLSAYQLFRQYSYNVKLVTNDLIVKSLSKEKQGLIGVSLKSFLSVALPLWITSLMLYVLTKFDLWVIGYSLSSADVSIYGTVLKMTMLLGVFFGIFNSVIAPIISELYQNKEIQKLEKTVRVAATVSAIPAFFLFLLFICFGHNILELLFGSFFREGALSLAILSFGVFINISTGCCGTLLMYTGHQKNMMIITVISGLTTMAISLYIVNFYGMIGVACASGGGMILQNVFMFFYARKKIGIWTHFDLKYLRKENIKDLLALKRF
jgi:O-antigen/teichoic acid export membrane protein